MGLLDVLNGMQNGPRGPSNPSAQSSGGMSPMTMAILGLLAWKAVKHLTASQPGAAPGWLAVRCLTAFQASSPRLEIQKPHISTPLTTSPLIPPLPLQKQ